MRIDAYTHFIPEKFFNKIVDSGIPISASACARSPASTISTCAGRSSTSSTTMRRSCPIRCRRSSCWPRATQVEEYAKLINDGFAEICAKYPDHFPGWVAQARSPRPTPACAKPTRAIKNGALGVQIYTNIAGKPLDDPEFEPFFAAMNKLGKPIWLHPARAANFPDYLSEKKSKYEIWWTFGWSYETAAAMARLVFSGIMDKYPNLKIITHHFGGIVPMLEGRIGPGWDQLGARTSDEDLSAGAQDA